MAVSGCFGLKDPQVSLDMIKTPSHNNHNQLKLPEQRLSLRRMVMTVDEGGEDDDSDDDGDDDIDGDDDSDDDKQWWAVALIETDDRPEAEWRRPRRDGPDENQTLNALVLFEFELFERCIIMD